VTFYAAGYNMSDAPNLKPSGWSRARYLAVSLFAVAVIIGLDWSRTAAVPAPASAAEWGRAGYGPNSFAAGIERATQQVSHARERLGYGPPDWLHEEGLARALMAKSRLSADYGDLAEAVKVIEAAQARAPASAGPSLTAAVIAMMAHRLDKAEAALAIADASVVPADAAEQAETAGLHGDIAFYRGDLAAARTWYDRAEHWQPGPGVAYRHASLAKATGKFDEAIRQFQSADPSPLKSSPFQHANTALQIGAVEQARGNYQAAAQWCATADRLFPGFWLFEAHRAQSLAISGDLAGAIAAMREVAKKTPSPEVMDALAMLLRADGRAAESRQWAERAGAIWAIRISQLPEAAYGHALEHELVFGTPKRALSLARANLGARPSGESHLLLASALLMSGEIAEALRQVEFAEDKGWRSAPLFALRAQALELQGRGDAARVAREAAVTLNPRIFAPETGLVWFSHG
jgi:tetratricopeptide (TPR) repeat protein